MIAEEKSEESTPVNVDSLHALLQKQKNAFIVDKSPSAAERIKRLQCLKKLLLDN